MRRWSFVAALAAAAVAVGAALPWVALGPRNVTGFDLVTIARRYGLAAGTAGTVGRLWLCIPLLAGVTVALALLGQPRRAGIVGAVVALAGLTAAGLAARASSGRCLVGVWVTGLAAVVALFAVPLALRTTPRGPTV
jgi:hypothetical protein